MVSSLSIVFELIPNIFKIFSKESKQRLSDDKKEDVCTPLIRQDVLPVSYHVIEADDARSDQCPEQCSLVVESSRQEVCLSLDDEIACNEAVVEERDQEIKEIQFQIGELHEISKDLAILVNEQGEMIDDIESNIVKASGATQEAKSELAKASTTQRSNDSTMTCLLLVILATVLLIVIIVLGF